MTVTLQISHTDKYKGNYKKQTRNCDIYSNNNLFLLRGRNGFPIPAVKPFDHFPLQRALC